MTKKEQYVMGRAEFLNETEGISLTEATKIAVQEWEWKKFAKEKGKEIDHFIRAAGSVCQNCKFRKENYKNIPDECRECGHIAQRNGSYHVLLPCFRENQEN